MSSHIWLFFFPNKILKHLKFLQAIKQRTSKNSADYRDRSSDIENPQRNHNKSNWNPTNHQKPRKQGEGWSRVMGKCFLDMWNAYMHVCMQREDEASPVSSRRLLSFSVLTVFEKHLSFISEVLNDNALVSFFKHIIFKRFFLLHSQMWMVSVRV